MVSENLMTVVMLPLLVLMTIVGYYVLIPGEIREQNRKIPMRRFMIGLWPFVVSASFVYLLVQSQATIVNFFGIKINSDYTSYIMMIEGDMVAHFQSFATPLLTYFNGFVYLMIFSFIMIFTFVILIFTRNVTALEEFTIAFIIIYLTAFPFYIFFPVTVTGHAITGVSTLLYDLSPIIDQGVRVVDPFLDNDFPSLHAALSVMAVLIVVFRTNLTRYKVFIIVSTFAILFSTLYLGIHWITDLVGGTVLALISYYIAVRFRKSLLEMLNKLLVSIEEKIGILDNIFCKNCSEQISIVPHRKSVNCPHCGSTIDYHPLTYD
ncbi:MAG TPA: phosphatase PAP2 family protein [Candidatus Nanoarchaeia archaeon]|nr:phosphatase PAP2 family protein [Candidatus Nanoarchaeia archaeon]